MSAHLRVRFTQIERSNARQRYGFPALGPHLTLAKLFSDTAKPFGVRVVLTREHEQELLATLPVTEISGIGSRRAARLLPL